MKRLAILIGFAVASLAEANATTITLIQFDDLHAHLTPHYDLIAQSNQTKVVERGGLARLTTLIKKIRAENPNSVLMNIGDTYHGGVEALFTNGNAIVDPVNALGIDVGVPGNWDFAYGTSAFRLRYATDLTEAQIALLEATTGTIKKPTFTNLAANLTYAPPSTNTGYVMPPTIHKMMGDVNVGFIGLTSDIVAAMDPALATGFAFTQGETDYKTLLETQASTLRSEGAQLIVVMSELGLQKNYRLADIIAPGTVDVIFSAHTHAPTLTPLQGRSGTLVLESGNDGNVGRLDVSITSSQKPTYKWTLIPVDNTLATDAGMKALVDAERAPFLVSNPDLTVPMRSVTLKLTQPIDKVTGYVDGALDRRNALESSFNDSWVSALRSYAKTDLAMTPGFRFDAIIAQPGTAYEDGAVANGAITVEDVYRFFPVPSSIAAGNVTGSRLQEIIESNLQTVFSLENFNQQGGWMNGLSGLTAQVDLSAADGTRVKSMALSPSGIAIAPDASLSIAGCQGPNGDTTSLCGYDGFSNVTALINPETGNKYYAQELFSKLIGSGLIHATNNNNNSIIDSAATPLWPSQPYIQPLMVDVTSQANIKTTSVSSSGTATVTLKNKSSTPLATPLKIILENLSADVTVSNATGYVHDLPYIKLPYAINPGETATVTIQFSSSDGKNISYTVRVASGGV